MARPGDEVVRICDWCGKRFTYRHASFGGREMKYCPPSTGRDCRRKAHNRATSEGKKRRR